MIFTRRTLRGVVKLEDVGLHSGAPVSAIIHPDQRGIVFRTAGGRTQATPENVTDTNRCTRLGDVATVEHLMAAFAALGVTDAEVEVEGSELPMLGACASGYLEAIAEAGLEEIGRDELTPIFSRVFVHEDQRKLAVAAGAGHWAYRFVAERSTLGEMEYKTERIFDDFRDEIAPARTIAFAHEIPAAQKAGLGKGLTEASTIIIEETGYRGEARFPNEPARHKLLDLVGDMYLSGVPIDLLNVRGDQTGHRQNVFAAAKLREACFPGR